MSKRIILLVFLTSLVLSANYELIDTTFSDCSGAYSLVRVTDNLEGIQSFLIEIDTTGIGVAGFDFETISGTSDWLVMDHSNAPDVIFGFSSPSPGSDFTGDGDILKIAIHPNCATTPITIAPNFIAYESTGDIPDDRNTVTSPTSGTIECTCGLIVTLVSPGMDAIITDPEVTFTWEPEGGTIDSYILQYSTSNAFPDDPSKTREKTTSSTTLTEEIALSGDIFWRVKGIHSGGETPWTPYKRIIRSYTPEAGGDAINWVQVPEDDTGLTLGQTFLAKARVFGTNCDVTGNWEVDGVSIKSFSHSFGSTRSSFVTECLLPTDALGSHTVQVTANDEVSIPPYFSQRDPEWSGDLMIPGDCSLDSRGAVVACCAMLLNYYGMDTDPGVLNSWLCSNSGYTDCLLYWDKIEDYSETAPGATEPLVSFDGRYGSWSPSVDVSTVSEIATSLDAGKPVLLEVAVGGSWPYHWVLAYSREGDNYLIHDPYFSERTTLSSYSNQITGYAVYSSTSSLYRALEASSATYWGSPFLYNVTASSNPRPWYFVLWSSSTGLFADGESEFTVHGTVYDADFNVVPTDEAFVEFEITGEGNPISPTSLFTTDGSVNVTIQTTTTPGTITIMPSIDCDINPPEDPLTVNTYSTEYMWLSDKYWCEDYIERLDDIHRWYDWYLKPNFDVSEIESYLSSIGSDPSESEKEILKRLRIALRAINLSYHHNNYSSVIDYNDSDFNRIEGMETVIDDLGNSVTHLCIAPVKLWVSILLSSVSEVLASSVTKDLIINLLLNSIQDLMSHVGSLLPHGSAIREFWNNITSTAMVAVRPVLNHYWDVLSGAASVPATIVSAIFDAIKIPIADKAMEPYLIQKFVKPTFQSAIDMASNRASSGTYSGSYEAGLVIVNDRLISIQESSSSAHATFKDATRELDDIIETMFHPEIIVPESFEDFVLDLFEVFEYGRIAVATAEAANAGDQIVANLYAAIVGAFNNGGLHREVPIDDGLEYYECSAMSYESRSTELSNVRDRYIDIANELQIRLVDEDTSRFSVYLDSLALYEDTLDKSINYAKSFIDAANPEATGSIPEFQAWYDSLYSLKAAKRTAAFKTYWHSSLYLNAFHDDSTSEDSLQTITITDIDSCIYYASETVNLMQTMLESLFGSEVAPIVYVESYSVDDSLWSGDSIYIDFVLVNAGAGNAESVTVNIDVESSMNVYPDSLFIDHIWERDTVHVQCVILASDTVVSDSSALQASLLAITPKTTNGFAQNEFVPMNVYYNPQPLPYRYYLNKFYSTGLAWLPDTIRYRGEEKYLASPDTFLITNIGNDTIQIGLYVNDDLNSWSLEEYVKDSAEVYDTTISGCSYDCYALRAVYSNTEPDTAAFNETSTTLLPDVVNWMSDSTFGNTVQYLAPGDTVHVWLRLDTPPWHSKSIENLQFSIDYREYEAEE